MFSTRIRAVVVAGVFILLGVMLPADVAAGPIAVVDFVETALGGGAYRYDYMLSNQADRLADPGLDIFDATLFLGAATATQASAPAGWDVIAGAGFLELFSIAPGAPPAGADIGPGLRLAGFSFIADRSLGPVPFQALFADSGDPLNPIVFEGLTSAAPAAVPEPATVLLLGPALGGWLAARRYRLTRS